MKKNYAIIIGVVLIVAIIIGILVGTGMKGSFMNYGGNIGVVEIEGVIYSSKKIVKNIKMFSEDPNIPAVIIRVDSPGGGVAAAQEIYAALKKLKESKKIVISMGAIAASGGYYISLPADVIVANPGTITGSIGVIMEFPILEELLRKVGINFEVVKSREYKDLGSPFRKMGDKERKLLQDVVTDVYEQFIEATCENRNLSRDSVIKYADGRILSGRQAKEIGFVDTLGSFEDALKIAGDMVGIEKPIPIFPPKRFSLIQLLIEPIEEIFLPKINYLWR